MLAYTLLWLVALDVAIDRLSAVPRDPRVRPSGLQRYFDYGRTVETKLRHMVGATTAASAPIVRAGWLDGTLGAGAPARASQPGHVLVAAYGQSFTEHLIEHLHELDPRFESRLLGGPSAPLSHSHAAYRLDRGRHQAQVAVIGILASSLPSLASMTNMTRAFEAPQPMTYPRYVLRGGKLEAIEPLVGSFAQLRAAMEDPAAWQRFQDQLARHDAAYAPWLFERDIFDASSLARTVRRAFGQKRNRELAQRFVGASGFSNYAGVLDVADALLADFARMAREDGVLPFVVLIHDRGYGDHLARALAPGLERRGVPYFSTHTIAPPDRENLFLKDGHFRPEVDRELARAFHAQLTAALHQRAQK